jgi:hypothetical protein
VGLIGGTSNITERYSESHEELRGVLLGVQVDHSFDGNQMRSFLILLFVIRASMRVMSDIVKPLRWVVHDEAPARGIYDS